MARVIIAKGLELVRDFPKPLTQAQQHQVAQYLHQAKVNPTLQLRAYIASGALEVFNPCATNKALDKGTIRAYKASPLAAGLGYTNTLNKRGNVVCVNNTKLSARVCHNMKGTTDKKFVRK